MLIRLLRQFLCRHEWWPADPTEMMRTRNGEKVCYCVKCTKRSSYTYMADMSLLAIVQREKNWRKACDEAIGILE